MGRVICTRHPGNDTGPLSCHHVLDAAYKETVSATHPTLINFVIDIGDRGAHHLRLLICDACAQQYNVVEDSILPDEFFAEEKLPWTAPICEECLRSLQADVDSH